VLGYESAVPTPNRNGNSLSGTLNFRYFQLLMSRLGCIDAAMFAHSSLSATWDIPNRTNALSLPSREFAVSLKAVASSQRAPDPFCLFGDQIHVTHLSGGQHRYAIMARQHMDMQVKHLLPARCFVELL